MNTMNLEIAVSTKTPIRFLYKGLIRAACPHLLGVSRDQRLVLHAYQYAGDGSKGPIQSPEQGGWRFFYLNDIESAPVLEHGAPWYPTDLQKKEGGYKPPSFIVHVLAIAGEAL